ncbi:hypothetical protein GRI58_04570 [Porphyrobacter algicida]|uniref:PAS domain-containing protein n=1 Tax=Qipengyuania algicida TaxID=1836209 RepID=A0A845AHR3_9SPHN|nr:hypothetical protein [Qipengyuania algicida]
MDRLGRIFGTHDDAETEDFESVEAETPPSPVGQDERRMQVRAYNHWASQLGDRNYPAIDDLDPDAMEDFGPHSVLLDFSDGVDDPTIRHLGHELAAECGAPVTITKLDEVPGRSLLSRITDHYMQILANEAPIGFEAEFINQRGLTSLYRGILLPYSSDDRTIDYIYGVINWKETADAATADALLAEIDQALGSPRAASDDTSGYHAMDSMLDLSQFAEADSIRDLGGRSTEDIDTFGAEMPQPAFGQSHIEETADACDAVAATDAEEAIPAYEDGDVYAGETEWGRGFSGFGEDDPIYAVDYGDNPLEDEEEGDDVEGVVDPLADQSVGMGLSSLVNRTAASRTKVTVSLAGSPEEGVDRDEASEEISAPFDNSASSEDFTFLASQTEPFAEDDEDDEDVAIDFAADDDEEREGLYDCLAAAREMAQLARSSEDRSRKALYQAVGRAYDFSLEAEANPEDFTDLISENGLSVQDRAPMTPVVKLVFGADYDKTRLTEYAAVLDYAHRIGVERGTLSQVLREAEGGLKGIVQAERRARKEASGKAVDAVDGIRASLAKKLRQIEPVALDDLASEGSEFGLVMIRRMDDGTIAILGEVPEDVQLVERAGRRMLG